MKNFYKIEIRCKRAYMCGALLVPHSNSLLLNILLTCKINIVDKHCTFFYFTTRAELKTFIILMGDILEHSYMEILLVLFPWSNSQILHSAVRIYHGQTLAG
jgi:hypothetical protein